MIYTVDHRQALPHLERAKPVRTPFPRRPSRPEPPLPYVQRPLAAPPPSLAEQHPNLSHPPGAPTAVLAAPRRVTKVHSPILVGSAAA